jgi:Transposase and inactivated derivatives
MKTICGLDIASTSACACVLDGTGVIVHQAVHPMSRAGEDQLLAKLPAGTAIYMESTGRYHLTWARRLSQAGHEVYVLNALLAKRLMGAANALRQNKTDRIDARELARVGLMHGADLQTYRFAEDPARSGLRALCKARVLQRRMLTDLTRNALHLLGMMLPECPLDIAHNRGVARLFLKIDSLARLRGMRSATLEQYACTQAGRLAEVLRGPLSAAELFDELLPALQSQLALMEKLRDHLLESEAKIREALRRAQRTEEQELVRTIPGFGEKTTPAIIACLPADLRAWGKKQAVAKKLQAHFGFDPKKRESGQWAGRVHMSKRGQELARTALFQVAVCALMHDPGLKAIYTRKRAEGTFHLVAISHIMRLQLRRLVAVLYDRKPFVSNLSTQPQPA